MDIIGKWKIKEFHIVTPEGENIYTPDSLPNTEEFEDFVRMVPTVIEFTADGLFNVYLPISEDMYEAIHNEEIEIRDGFAVMESTTWKEIDGKFFFDSKIEGELLGEKVDPFMEIKVTKDGCLLCNFDTLLLEKI